MSPAQIAYYFPDAGTAFVGDALFALGCGRLFEGTPAQAWESLQRLMALPDSTVVYCAHEYTTANARFAVTIEPSNPALLERVQDIEAARKKDLPTVPTTIGLERRTNPFVRPAPVRSALALDDTTPDVEVFAEVRRPHALSYTSSRKKSCGALT